MMDRLAVYGMKALSWLRINPANYVAYLVSLLLSCITAAVLIATINIPTTILAINSSQRILIIYAFIFLFSIFYYLFYVHFRFFKRTGKSLFWTVLSLGVIIVIYVVLVFSIGGVLSWGGFGFDYFPFAAMLGVAAGIMRILSLVLGWRSKHRIKTHFESTIDSLEKIQNNEINGFKDLYRISEVSDKYNSGIKEINNLLIRGIDLNGIFNLKTELSLNEILDQLTFSMQYYLLYGGPEQMKVVKNHLKRMSYNFDEEYHINANQFTHEILRMYNEMDIYFKENNIYIERSIKFIDRAIGYLPQALLAIVLLILSIFLKNYAFN